MVNKGNQWIKSEEYQREVAIDSVSIRIKLFHLPVNYIAIEKIPGIKFVQRSECYQTDGILVISCPMIIYPINSIVSRVPKDNCTTPSGGQ